MLGVRSYSYRLLERSIFDCSRDRQRTAIRRSGAQLSIAQAISYRFLEGSVAHCYQALGFPTADCLSDWFPIT